MGASIGASIGSAFGKKKAIKAQAEAEAQDAEREAAMIREEHERQAEDAREEFEDMVESHRAQRAATGLFESEEAYERTGAGTVESENIREGEEHVASLIQRGKNLEALYKERARRIREGGKSAGRAALTTGLIGAATTGALNYDKFTSPLSGIGKTNETSASAKSFLKDSVNLYAAGETRAR